MLSISRHERTTEEDLKSTNNSQNEEDGRRHHGVGRGVGGGVSQVGASVRELVMGLVHVEDEQRLTAH